MQIFFYWHRDTRENVYVTRDNTVSWFPYSRLCVTCKHDVKIVKCLIETLLEYLISYKVAFSARTFMSRVCRGGCWDCSAAVCGHVRHVFLGAGSRAARKNGAYVLLNPHTDESPRRFPEQRAPMRSTVADTVASGADSRWYRCGLTANCRWFGANNE